MDLPAGRAHVGIEINGLARTASILAYGHHGWTMDSLRLCERADVGTERTTGRTDNGTDKMKT